MKPRHIVVSALVAVLSLAAVFAAQHWLELSLALRAAKPDEPSSPRRITMKDLGPAFEIYSDAKDGEGEEETKVDLLAKNMGETSQAIKTETYSELRELIARKLAGEDVCNELEDRLPTPLHRRPSYTYRVVCTPRGIFEWVDPEFAAPLWRCTGYRNRFAYRMCMDGRLPRITIPKSQKPVPRRGVSI